MKPYLSIMLLGAFACEQSSPLSNTLPKVSNEEPTIQVSSVKLLSAFTALKTIELPVNTVGSKIEWTGTKLVGYHQGIVSIASGKIRIENRKLVGGSFIIDMNSIENTDIPDNDPIPKRKLVEHLKGEDFFDVKNYPTANFTINQVVAKKLNTCSVSGNLTMHGKTRPVTFTAKIIIMTDSSFLAQTNFDINRQEWGVAYKGLKDQLVHDEVNLQLILAANK
jgi:polyisoprenoid-binding protein YceI